MPPLPISGEKRARPSTSARCDPFVEFITSMAFHPVAVDILLRRTEWVLVGLTRLEKIDFEYATLELDWNTDAAALTKRDPDSLDCATTRMPLADFRELVIEWRNIVLQGSSRAG